MAEEIIFLTMNKFVKLKRNDPFKTYINIGCNDLNLDIYKIFLTEDVDFDNKGSRFRQWALSDDKEDFFIQAGETLLEKENNKIYIECIWYSDEPNPPRAELSVEEFVSGLDQWNELVNVAPMYILIKKEDNKIIIEGSDSEQIVKDVK